MKKFAAILLLMLAACTSIAEQDVAAPLVIDVPTALSSRATSEPESSVGPSLEPFMPATTVEEAAVIRDQDQVIGAAEPIVAIIEYGDYQ